MLKSHYRQICEDNLLVKQRYFNPTPGFGRPRPGMSQQCIALPVNPVTHVKVQKWLEDSKKYFGITPPGLERKYREVEPSYPTYELLPNFSFSKCTCAIMFGKVMKIPRTSIVCPLHRAYSEI
ncbi:hypothetical protein ACJJTC_007882 [Scirpophaga incertulas]